MNDERIIELYFAREEAAITETDRKYGSYCRRVTLNILENSEDSEECVNDTYMKLWNAIPPKRPKSFGAFVAAAARNVALNMLRGRTAEKRGGKGVSLAFDEISDCLPSAQTVESVFDEKELVSALNSFLGSLDKKKRTVFMKRYFHFFSMSEIASDMGMSEENVRTTLFRTREKLRKFLEKEGISI